MRIRSGVTPTPIVGPVAPQQPAADAQSVGAGAPASAPPRIDTAPLLVDLGDKLIELQPGELVKVVDKMNQTARVFNHSLQFQLHEGSGKIIIKVVDTISGAVLREIPPEKLLEAHQSMEELLGLLLDVRM